MLALEVYRNYGGPLSDAQRAARYRLKRHEKVTPASLERDENGPPSPDPRVSVVLKTYSEMFSDKYGEKPQIHGGKDGAHAKRLLKQYGQDKLLALLRQFFDSDDPFIAASGRSFGVFVSQINKLLTLNGQKPKWRNPNHGANCECSMCSGAPR